MLRILLIFVLIFSLLTSSVSAQEVSESPKTKLLVTAPEQRVAIPESFSTYSTPASSLNYEPLVDLQVRNIAEAQGDVTIRGGIFENSGFMVGASNLFDPQTGHYFAEIPIPQSMLTLPSVLTGSENAIFGFNSTVGTVSYGWKPIEEGGELTAAFGNHNLNFQSVKLAEVYNFDEEGRNIGMEVDYSRAESDGTISGGDYDFERFAARFQLNTPGTQTDLFAGYQDKFFGWPNLYVLPELHNLVGSSGNETEQLRTTLVTLNHRINWGADEYTEFGAYYRRHTDDYEFDRSNPGLFNPFEHETDVFSASLNGKESISRNFGVLYSGQFLSDEIDSTSLLAGSFNSRSYSKLSLVPEYKVNDLTFRAGSSWDYTNRDSSRFLPVAEVIWDASEHNSIYLQYSSASQVPGYTAINSSSEAGLFRGNQNLSRERSRNIETGIKFNYENIKARASIFYREDRDLVDWTFSETESSFASRFANNVDIDVFGFESLVRAKYDMLESIFSYTYLNKDAEFQSSDIIGSFYALNFPTHRATASFIAKPYDRVTLRADTEFRYQEANPLRNGKREAYFAAVSCSWLPPVNLPGGSKLELSAIVDNIWKESFEEVPGVPGRGRQVTFQGKIFW